MKKIVFFLQNGEICGAERVLLNIINFLKHENVEIHLVFINNSRGFNRDSFDFVTIHELRSKRARNSLTAVMSCISKIKPNIVFSTLSRINVLLIISSLLLKLIGIKFKTICRYPNMPKAELQNLPLWQPFIYKTLYRKVDMLICQSIEMKNDVKSIYSINEKNLLVISNPIDEDYIKSSVDGSNSPFPNLKGGAIKVLSSGRLTHQKGFDLLLYAIKKVIVINPKFHFFILGGGDDKYRNYLIDLCNTLELDTHVHFIGNKINPYPYYKFCDLFVLSSRWEGLPNVILELIHFNKPIVSTDCVPVIKRIIGPNNGVLVNTDDIDSLAQGILIGLDSKTNYLYKNTKAEFIEVFNV